MFYLMDSPSDVMQLSWISSCPASGFRAAL